MNGRTHRYIAFSIVTLVMALLSAVITAGFWMPIFIFVLMGISIILYGRAAELLIKKDEFMQDAKSKHEEKKPETLLKIEQDLWVYKKTEAAAWSLLIFNMIFTIVTADFLPDLHRGVSIGLTLLTLPVVVMAGSFFSDWDWDWGSEFHRNPLLHSYFIPFLIWVFGMIVFPYEYRYMNLVSGMFCLAFATHLIADCVPSTTTGLWNILRDFFDFNKTSGDLRQFPEHWEHKWLFFSGVILLGCFGLSLPRMYGIVGFDWSGVDENGMIIWSPQIILLILLAVVGIGSWIVIYIKAVNITNKSKKTKSKEKKSPITQTIASEDLIVLDHQLPLIKQDVVKIFETQPVISTRALLFKELEKASHIMPVEDVYQRLKSEKFIVFSRSAPSGFKLGSQLPL